MHGIRRREFTRGAAAGVLAGPIVGADPLLTAIKANAQDYPARPVTLIAPFPPGTTPDGIARMLGHKLAERWGKPLIVENRVGAGGVTGTTAVAKAAADGYTLLVGTSAAFAINPTLHKKLPYDPAKDFVFLAFVANAPFILVVNPSLPVHSVTDLIKLTREKPGQLSYGSAGPGSPPHLLAELLKHMTGIQMTHVPYRGSPQALNDVVAGHAALMFADPTPALPLIREGKVRALGVSSLTRVAYAPEIPPISESGVPGYEAVGRLMIVGPVNMPTEIVNRLYAELKIILAMPEIAQWIGKSGLIPVSSPSPEEMQRLVTSEIVHWGRIIEQIGLAGSQ
jgi:tripartite-type tricarboxylate transporter receptor subunit TctC